MLRFRCIQFGTLKAKEFKVTEINSFKGRSLGADLTKFLQV